MTMQQRAYIHGLSLAYGEDDQDSFLGKCLPWKRVAPVSPNIPDLKNLLPCVKLRRVSSAGRMALRTACLALRAGRVAFPLAEDSAETVGLYIGSAYGAVESSFSFMDSILEANAHFASPTYFSHSINNGLCGMLSLNLNIQGPACTVCQFELSFAGAWQAALEALRSGAVRYALVGAAEEASKSLQMVYSHTSVPHPSPVPDTACAVFFLLSCEEAPVTTDIRWFSRSADAYSVGFADIADAVNGLQRPYAAHPAAQALDAFISAIVLEQETTASPKLVCRHGASQWTSEAAIILERISICDTSG
jgi:hypothetical protein